MRWTTDKAGVFVPPSGVALSPVLGDNVGANQTAGGFTVVLVNTSMSNFISSLQVSGSDVAGVQVSCLIDGITDTITPRLAGELKSLCLSAHALKAYQARTQGGEFSGFE